MVGERGARRPAAVGEGRKCRSAALGVPGASDGGAAASRDGFTAAPGTPHAPRSPDRHCRANGILKPRNVGQTSEPADAEASRGLVDDALLRLDGAAEAAEVFGDRVLEAFGDLRRRLGANRGPLGAVVRRGELQLELLRQVHEPLELLLDELRIPAQAAAQRLAEIAHRLQLLVGEALVAQLIAERQQLARRIGQVVARLVDGCGFCQKPRLRGSQTPPRRGSYQPPGPPGPKAPLRSPNWPPRLPAAVRLLTLALLRAALLAFLAGLSLAGLPWLLIVLALAALALLCCCCLLRELGELAAQRLQLRDELCVRIRARLLAVDRFRIRRRERGLRVALQIAQRRRGDRIGRRDLRARAAENRLGAVAEPRARLRALQVGERLIELLARAGCLLPELLRDALNFALERLELVLELGLAIVEFLRLLVGEPAAAAVALLAPLSAFSRSASCKSFAAWRCSS